MSDTSPTSTEVECVYGNGCGKPEGECAVTCKAVLDAVARTIGTSRPDAFPGVQGRCPACHGASLFLGAGGHVTCSRLDCPDPCKADDLLHRGKPGPPATEAADAETTTRVFAALHHGAEQDVTRVIGLYEQWVKAGPPPLGVPLARLAELHAAILPASEEPARATPNNPTTSKEAL